MFLFTIFAILDVIRNLPESSRPSRTMTIKVLVEPVAEDTSAAAGAADLNTFTAPALFAVRRIDVSSCNNQSSRAKRCMKSDKGVLATQKMLACTWPTRMQKKMFRCGESNPDLLGESEKS
jgi:hypothetical protein